MLSFDPIAHRYTWRGNRVIGVTEAIRSVLGDPFERVAGPVLRLAQQRGKAVHAARDLDDAGRLDEASIDPQIRPYLDAWRLFRSQFHIKILFSEAVIYSELYGYAGTPDVAAEFANGDIAVIDAKTGLPGLYAELQSAAYAELIARRLAIPADSIRRFALRMLPTGKYQFPEHTSRGDWRDYLSCLNVARLQERIANGN